MSDVLMIVKKACDSLSPLVRCIYDKQSSEDLSTQKADLSYFTIADGLVQELILRYLFKTVKFKAVVAEEDVAVDLQKQPFSVGQFKIPENSEIATGIQKACAALESYSKELEMLDKGGTNGVLAKSTLFLDPIDGTKEFVQKKGECCTICIGFSRDGKADAGLVYRPIPPTTTWAAGCSREGFFTSELAEIVDKQHDGDDDDGDCGGRTNTTTTTMKKKKPTFLTPQRVSDFLAKVIDEMEGRKISVGGCGNKALLLLEHRDHWYILDRGLSRWDTCAAQAVLEAQGGRMTKLTSFCPTSLSAADDGDTKDDDAVEAENYIYEKTDVNLDWNPEVELTRYNARGEFQAEIGNRAADRHRLLPYSNVCGIVAHPRITQESWEKMVDVLKRVSAAVSPKFT